MLDIDLAPSFKCLCFIVGDVAHSDQFLVYMHILNLGTPCKQHLMPERMLDARCSLCQWGRDLMGTTPLFYPMNIDPGISASLFIGHHLLHVLCFIFLFSRVSCFY